VPLYTADALVLRTYKLGETDRIVVFLTRDRGKKRGVAKGARRPRSRFTGALEPLTEVHVEYFESERRELVGLNYAETIRSPLSIGYGTAGPGEGRRADTGPEALGYVGYFSELLDEWALEADADDRLYRLGASMLEALAAGAPVESLARYFEYWLLRLQGVYPSVRQCPACGGALGAGAAMPSADEVFLCRDCMPGTAGTRLSAEAMTFLAAATAVGPDNLATLVLGSRAARELEVAHRRLITVHLDKDLKSARVLREMRQLRQPAPGPGAGGFD
jgi:DNA repair protein RecO (recombination protein O)